MDAIHLDDTMSTAEIRQAMRNAPAGWELKPGRHDGRDWTNPPPKDQGWYQRETAAPIKQEDILSLWTYLAQAGIARHRDGVRILRVSHALRWYDETKDGNQIRVNPERRRARVAKVG